MKCPRCGADMKEGQMYCEHCGREIQIVPEFDPALETSLHKALSDVWNPVSRRKLRRIANRRQMQGKALCRKSSLR